MFFFFAENYEHKVSCCRRVKNDTSIYSIVQLSEWFQTHFMLPCNGEDGDTHRSPADGGWHANGASISCRCVIEGEVCVVWRGPAEGRRHAKGVPITRRCGQGRRVCSPARHSVKVWARYKKTHHLASRIIQRTEIRSLHISKLYDKIIHRSVSTNTYVRQKF